MKIFAYYLPQFHCIPENDKWWGKGFTEWTNVKKAQALYKGHIQPKHPLDNRYYDLTDVNTMKWQANLMEKYNVDGLIFYHYYFTGKKLLEKPAEILLHNKEIKMPFFFCWANHSWFRSWEGSKELLINQKYGGEKEWEKHFKYLLSFFKDDRYEKINNKPVLMVFKSNFSEKEKMFRYFDSRCKEEGFEGICVIETFESYNKNKINKFIKEKSTVTEYIHLREPGAVTEAYYKNIINVYMRIVNKIKMIINNSRLNIKLIKKFNGNKFFKIMKKNQFKDKQIIRGLFFEWDNTPRHDKRGYVITPGRKKEVMEYLDSIRNDEYLFINAWNEWCEGMILEPTIENEYKYLEWIKEWKVRNENRFNGI